MRIKRGFRDTVADRGRGRRQIFWTRRHHWRRQNILATRPGLRGSHLQVIVSVRQEARRHNHGGGEPHGVLLTIEPRLVIESASLSLGIGPNPECQSDKGDLAAIEEVGGSGGAKEQLQLPPGI